MKLRAELSSLEMTLDIQRLEGHQEAQALEYLVECTKPLDDDETEEDRQIYLQRLLRFAPPSHALALTFAFAFDFVCTLICWVLLVPFAVLVMITFPIYFWFCLLHNVLSYSILA